MAEQDLIDRQIFAAGQSQNERLPPELAAQFVVADERSPADLYRFLQRLAPHIRFFQDDPQVPAGTWQNFFAHDLASIQRWLDGDQGDAPPHLGLLLSFLKLYQQPQALLNETTARHLAFYYRDVLRFAAKPAQPDHAHLLLELKKNTAPIKVDHNAVFSAGKDAIGVERLYRALTDTVINRSQVVALHSVYRDDALHGSIRFAAIANSADGFGAALPEAEPKWPAFGHVNLPPARVGFAIASPVLRLAEGERQIELLLTLSGMAQPAPSSAVLSAAFELYLTADKRWLGPLPYTASIVSGAVLRVQVTIPATEAAIVDYDSAVHSGAFSATSPVLQLLLKPGTAQFGYEDCAALVLQQVQLKVKVDAISTLALDSDAGKLDPKKAFLPFGPQPVTGSRFVIGCPEAFSKKLTELKLILQWKAAPGQFSSHYQHYNAGTIDNGSFTCGVSFHDGGHWHVHQDGVRLFGADGRTETQIRFQPGSEAVTSSPSTGYQIYALATAGAVWSQQQLQYAIYLNNPLQSYTATPPAPQPGALVLALERDFLHAQYRKRTIEEAYATGDKDVLNEPYSPMLQYLKLAYQASTDAVAINSNSLASFAHPDVQFFHVGCFGVRREHRYQREQLAYVHEKSVSLLPSFPDQGECLIGIAEAEAGDSLSLLLQVAEGSADPELPRQPVRWQVLCDNYWKPFADSELVQDSSNGLLTSGVVKLVLPREATRHNSWLSTDRIWLRASVPQQVSAVSELLQIASNAVEVAFVDQGNDPNHLLQALPAKQISKLKTPLAGIKSIVQPYASFGGRAAESADALHQRAAERLRHKQRAITVWDYERLVLERFPNVYRVKCIAHAKPDNFLAPGHLLVIVVPDLRQRNGRDPLQPKVDANTLSEIQAFLAKHSAMQVQIQVRNPRYQKLRLEFAVRFHAGYEFNFYRNQLEQMLIAELSPWAFGSGRSLQFGGRIYKSVLLDRVEAEPYVDYLQEFKLYSWSSEGAWHQQSNLPDRNDVSPDTPDSILVSDAGHGIVELV